MTMPHLENCHHSESGWCLACVKSLHEECELRTNERNKAYFVTYAAGEFAAGRISKGVLLGIVKTWEHDEGDVFNGWRERAIALQKALKGARTKAREDGVTTRLFAEWCGVSPTLLSEWTGDELPRTPPDFIETSATTASAGAATGF